jgi:glycerol-1-phosphate dehydrogenase [NAD(P)+]
MWPALETEPDALARASRGWSDFVVLTTASPWKSARSMLAVTPDRVLMVEGLDRRHLDRRSADARNLGLVVGIGSGVVMEAAKYVAKATGARLIQVPSTVSNNACFTCGAWTLVDGTRVIERGIPIPDRIILDPDLVAAAPARLNRAGLAEILCSHTALHDWHLGHTAGRDVDWDDELAQAARAELAALVSIAPLVGAGCAEGFRAIFEAGARFAPGFMSHPRARFNAGSEHLFAWALETRARRPTLHGEAVSLGVLLLSVVQNNHPDWAADIVRAARIAYLPEDIGVTWADVEDAFNYLGNFAKTFPWYTVIDHIAAGEAAAWPGAAHFAKARNFVLGLG